jgi:uncharacterized membrane protein
MSWIGWATIGYFFNSIVAIVDKSLLGQKRLDNPAVYTFAISCLGLLSLCLIPFGWATPSLRGWLYGILSGTCFTVALWTMFTVLKSGEASRVPAFIGSLNPIIVFIASYFLIGERLAFWHVAAFLVLVCGGFLMVGGPGGLKRRDMLRATVSSVFFGLAFVFIKLAFSEVTFVTGLVVTRLGGFLSSLCLLLIPGTWESFCHMIGKTSNGLKVSFVAGQIFGALSGIFNSYAVSLASVTLVEALQGMQYVFILILALAVSYKWPDLFKEEFSRGTLARKIAGIVLIAGGLWWLSWV